MRRVRIKWVLFALVAVVSGLTIVVLVRTWTFTSKQLAPAPATPLTFDEEGAVRHLRRALRIMTISFQDPSRASAEAFAAFHTLLSEAFPRVHAALRRETVSDHSLLFTWAGADSSREPVLLLAHMDVVPADPSSGWTHGPFSGDLADGYIWGRGALDDKSSVLGILEAVEALLAEGFRPRRTVCLAFGHDEEVGGRNGAARIAALLQSRGVDAALSLDEGMAIVDGIVPGAERPVALVGVAEKGYLTLELTVEGAGGHSSQPPRQTTLGILGAAVARIESNPMPSDLRDPVRRMLGDLGPEMSFGMRAVLSNLWLFEPLVTWQLSGATATDAALRTTTAVTMMSGGTKENVLPTRARAVVNFRILPGDTVDDVIAHVKHTVDDDRVRFDVRGQANGPSLVSDADSPDYALLDKAIRQVFPEVWVAPALDLAATDSRHYEPVTRNQFRFGPLWMEEEDLSRIHGPNERIGRDHYLRGIRFFAQFIRNASS